MPRRLGFTLLELLIVLLILALALALAWPRIDRMQQKSRLKSAAKQVRIVLGEARIAAIESGSAYAFRFRPGTGAYQVGPHAAIVSPSLMASIARQNQAVAEATADAVVAVGPDGLTSVEPDAEKPTSDTKRISSLDEIGEAYSQVDRRLIDGVVFAGVRVAEATRAASVDSNSAVDPIAAAAVQSAAAENAWSEPIVFYPNGRTSSGTIRLHCDFDDRWYQIDITLRGLTGTSHISPLRRGGFTFDGDAVASNPPPVFEPPSADAGPGALPPDTMTYDQSMSALGQSYLDVPPADAPAEADNGYSSAWPTVPPTTAAEPPGESADAQPGRPSTASDATWPPPEPPTSAPETADDSIPTPGDVPAAGPASTTSGGDR